MTDTDSDDHYYTSGCGSVTVVNGDTAAPTVTLTADAVRLSSTELAELIVYTAVDAADHARQTRAEIGEGFASADEALDHLKRMRTTLSQDGPAAAIAEQRTALGAPEPELPENDPRRPARIAPDKPGFPTGMLDMAIDVLERFGNADTSSLADTVGTEGVIGSAASEDESVIIKARGPYPIAWMVLGNHAREEGPEALAQLITETAARAAEDRDARQRAELDDADLPIDLEQVDAAPGQARERGDKALGQAAFLRQNLDDITRRLRQ